VTVHVRRAILLFALVLGLTALAAAVSPSRDTSPPAATPSPSVPPSEVLPRTVAFATRESGVPQVRRARVGEHIVITVSVASTEGGIVTIPRLGRTSSVSTDAPAHFDVLAPAAGRYDALLELGGAQNEPRRVGTLITRP
jgi:hypothetical protein